MGRIVVLDGHALGEVLVAPHVLQAEGRELARLDLDQRGGERLLRQVRVQRLQGGFDARDQDDLLPVLALWRRTVRCDVVAVGDVPALFSESFEDVVFELALPELDHASVVPPGGCLSGYRERC